MITTTATPARHFVILKDGQTVWTGEDETCCCQTLQQLNTDNAQAFEIDPITQSLQPFVPEPAEPEISQRIDSAGLPGEAAAATDVEELPKANPDCWCCIVVTDQRAWITYRNETKKKVVQHAKATNTVFRDGKIAAKAFYVHTRPTVVPVTPNQKSNWNPLRGSSKNHRLWEVVVVGNGGRINFLANVLQKEAYKTAILLSELLDGTGKHAFAKAMNTKDSEQIMFNPNVVPIEPGTTEYNPVQFAAKTNGTGNRLDAFLKEQPAKEAEIVLAEIVVKQVGGMVQVTA